MSTTWTPAPSITCEVSVSHEVRTHARQVLSTDARRAEPPPTGCGPELTGSPKQWRVNPLDREFRSLQSGCKVRRSFPGYPRPMAYEYKVVEVREKRLGGKMSGDKLENLLNEQARQGWQLKAITAADVKGRIGPGGVEGLMVTFERSV
jgi:hypothetical protein